VQPETSRTTSALKIVSASRNVNSQQLKRLANASWRNPPSALSKDRAEAKQLAAAIKAAAAEGIVRFTRVEEMLCVGK
jgi:hypothetical protein